MTFRLPVEVPPPFLYSYTPGYRPPATGDKALPEGRALIVVPDRVMCFGTGDGTFAEFEWPHDRTGSGSEAPVIVKAVCAATIGGHKAVRPADGGILPSSSADASQANATIGLTLGATASGSVADVAVVGPVEEPSWSWSPGPVFIGTNGALTQSPPGAGFIQRLGVALSATKIAVQIGPATIKA